MFELEEDEKILLEILPHPYFLWWPIFWSLLISFLILGYIVWRMGLSFWFFAGVLFCAGTFWTYALLSWVKFYQDRAYLTNRRLWVRQQKGRFQTSVKEVALKDILEVHYTIPGLKASILGYGDLKIKTAGGKIVLKKVPNPEKIKRQILNLRDYWLRNT
ncbi:PH domain-containing protein [bacterium]|nr:PH domain-containing protein [bacterium]